VTPHATPTPPTTKLIVETEAYRSMRSISLHVDGGHWPDTQPLCADFLLDRASN
jgi:hypothetical protein